MPLFAQGRGGVPYRVGGEVRHRRGATPAAPAGAGVGYHRGGGRGGDTMKGGGGGPGRESMLTWREQAPLIWFVELPGVKDTKSWITAITDQTTPCENTQNVQYSRCSTTCWTLLLLVGHCLVLHCTASLVCECSNIHTYVCIYILISVCIHIWREQRN